LVIEVWSKLVRERGITPTAEPLDEGP
jgi:hypothetical protein